VAEPPAKHAGFAYRELRGGMSLGAEAGNLWVTILPGALRARQTLLTWYTKTMPAY
jgi:hypothetical protein